MAELQEADYGEARDYTLGSPHLAHSVLRTRIEHELTGLVGEQVERTGACRVLEVGAGHGTFTACLVAAGATVTVTEMSEPSAQVLAAKFRHQPAVTVVHDPDGSAVDSVVAAGCDLLVFISVLHHIPDYVGVVTGLVDRWHPGARATPSRTRCGTPTVRAGTLRSTGVPTSRGGSPRARSAAASGPGPPA